MDFLDPEYGTWLGKIELADTPQPPGTVFILGDSCASADLVPPVLGSDVINLGLGGACPVEEYFVAKRFLRASRPRAVIISFVPANLASINRTGSQVNILNRGAKYGLLDSRDLEEIREHSRELRDDSIFDRPAPLDIDARLKIWLLGHHFPACYFGELIGGRFNLWKRENSRRRFLTEQARGYFGGHGSFPRGALDRNATLVHFRTPATVDYYFRQILALFEARGIPVYFVSMPISEISLAAMRPEVKEGYETYLKDLARSYPNFHVLGNPFSSFPPRYFFDDTHLATDGAVLWSHQMRDVFIDGGLDPGTAAPQWQMPSD
jgi:hypothetical protein